jgi:phage tail-like protein
LTAISNTMPLLRTFRFNVKLLQSTFEAEGVELAAVTSSLRLTGTALADGAFQECTGLDVELDVQELVEGGRNNGVIRRVGRAKYSPIVLKRGMFYSDDVVNRDLWTWLEDVASGVRPVRRYDGIVEVMSVGETVAARWLFERGLPAKITGPQLNAKTGEIAIEELHIAHEGLRLVAD